MRRRRDSGSASLELLGMLPLALIFAVLALQVGAFLWAITSTNEAVRQGARAQSLTGSGGCAAAQDTLTSTLQVQSCRATGGQLGSQPSVELVVTVPILAPVADLVPDVRITREANLP